MTATHHVQVGSRPEQPAIGYRSKAPAAAGLILVDSAVRPVHYSSEAIALLSYPPSMNETPGLPPEIKNWLGRSAQSSGPWPTLEFTAGRRRYTCRAFPLRQSRVGKPCDVLTALLLERKNGNAIQIVDIGARFHLSPREEETVRLLALGLTSKEIATRMNISPNTVKAFFRLVMTKMGVTTRSGVVGRIAGF